MGLHRVVGLLLVAAIALGCERVPESMREHGDAAVITADTAKPQAAAKAGSPGAPAAPPAIGKLEWISAPATPDVAAYVRSQLARAKSNGRTLLIEVGATWCEPCQRFHAAADRGELDKAFPTLTVVSFDVDQAREELAVAGYTSRLIPLFAVPKADGTASGKQIEGSIKGSGAVDEITPKLRALIASS